MSPATLGAEAIVEIWERGRREHALDRALTILAVLERRSRGELAQISVERRDNLLLAWRTRLFGAAMAGYAACPSCGCGVDVSLNAPPPDAGTDDGFVLDVGGTAVAVRMPTSADLAAALGCPSVAAARELLLRRCVVSAEDAGADGVAVDGAALTDELLAAVETELDARAEISARAVPLTCPDCRHAWTLELDVAAFLWREIEILAGRLLRDVDVLAQRYGWSEREILGLSAARRGYYLELAS